MQRISSRQNALVKRFRRISAGDPSGEWILLDGEHLVQEALASGATIDVAAFSDVQATGAFADLATRLAHSGASVVAVTADVLAAMSPVRHPSGVVAIARRPAPGSVDLFRARPSLILILAGVQDPGNVGAVIRASEACGATGVVTTPGTADPFGWKALRGSMGSAFRLPIAAEASLDAAIRSARASGLRVIATSSRQGTALPSCDLAGDCAVLLGGEGSGLPDAAVEAADERITIPMRPPVESLNVAIAAALVLYEAARQRGSHTTQSRSTNVAV